MTKSVTVAPSRAVVNLEFVRGDDLTPFVVQLRYPSQAPIVPTGFAALAQIRKGHDSSTVLAELNLTLAQGMTPEDLAVTVRLSDTITKELDFSSGVWDLQVTKPNGEINTPIYGAVTCRKDTSRG